jgi:ketosteroid isomerase-like protein
VSEDNLDIMRREWEAWLERDMDALAAFWDPEVVWDLEHFQNWPESSHEGVDAVRRFLTDWLEMWAEYEIDIEEVLPAPDGRVVSLYTTRAKGRESDLPMVLDVALIATFRNGKIIRFDAYDNRAEALNEVGLGSKTAGD